jgi:DNA repair ATPase RecN
VIAKYHQFLDMPFPPQTLMTGIEPMLKELCQKMSNIENKLKRLDNIEARLNSMESKFNAYDSDILSCKSRIDKISIMFNK